LFVVVKECVKTARSHSVKGHGGGGEINGKELGSALEWAECVEVPDFVVLRL
jgi:hypothetical protein